MSRYEKGPRKPWQKFYDTADWRNTSNLVKQLNPICQRIHSNGKQCHHPSTIVHHILDPRDRPDLRLAFSNLVAVCANHHAGGEKGETQDELYVHTIAPLKQVYPHNGHDGGWPSWRPEYNPDTAPRLLKPGKATAIGDDALDAALDAYQKMAVEKTKPITPAS